MLKFFISVLCPLILAVSAQAASPTVRDGVYIFKSEENSCGVLVQHEAAAQLVFSYTTHPQSFKVCDKDAQVLWKFKCIGVNCIETTEGKIKIVSADVNLIALQNTETDEVAQLGFISAKPVKPRIFENAHFFGWNWEISEQSTRRCSFDDGKSKLCSNISRNEVAEEIDEKSVIASAQSEPLQSCISSGLSSCHVEATFSNIVINQIYAPHPGYANREYRTGRLVNVVVKGNE